MEEKQTTQWPKEIGQTTIYRYCWNVATYKWKVHNGKLEIIYFVVKFRS